MCTLLGPPGAGTGSTCLNVFQCEQIVLGVIQSSDEVYLLVFSIFKRKKRQMLKSRWQKMKKDNMTLGTYQCTRSTPGRFLAGTCRKSCQTCALSALCQDARFPDGGREPPGPLKGGTAEWTTVKRLSRGNRNKDHIYYLFNNVCVG